MKQGDKTYDHLQSPPVGNAKWSVTYKHVKAKVKAHTAFSAYTKACPILSRKFLDTADEDTLKEFCGLPPFGSREIQIEMLEDLSMAGDK